MVKQNVGGLERVIRITLGVGMLSVYVLADGIAEWIGLIGIVPLVTGILGICPAYLALGIRIEAR